MAQETAGLWQHQRKWWWHQRQFLSDGVPIAVLDPITDFKAVLVTIVTLVSTQKIQLTIQTFDWSDCNHAEELSLFGCALNIWHCTIWHLRLLMFDLIIIFNFLSMEGIQHYEWWAPIDSKDKCVFKKRDITVFLNHLAFMMDHKTSSWYHIYELKDIHIKVGESPMNQSLVSNIQYLTSCCQFPSDDKYECIIQYHLICTLDDCELVRKFL